MRVRLIADFNIDLKGEELQKLRDLIADIPKLAYEEGRITTGTNAEVDNLTVRTELVTSAMRPAKCPKHPGRKAVFMRYKGDNKEWLCSQCKQIFTEQRRG